MSELFPSDAYLENLSGATETATGVYYPAKGEGLDWYVSFVKCIYRLVKNASVASGLRVYKTGALACGVKSGKFFDGNILRVYAGTETQALADNATNYVYLTADGALTVNTSGFPDPGTTRHLRLATVRTLDGEFGDDDISDFRTTQIWNVAGPISNLAGGAVGTAELASGVAGLLAKIQFQVGTEGGNTIVATLQALDCRDEPLAQGYLLHVWLSDSAYGSETATAPDGTVGFPAGAVLAEVSVKKRWQMITGSEGQAAISLGESGTRTWYLNAEMNGRIYTSSAISFS